jgi:MYXO-CTERM domain-containing protein
MKRAAWAMAAAGSLLGMSAPAAACSPPITAWFVQDSFPASDAEGAPINGVIAVYLDFVTQDSGSPLPEAAIFEQTVRAEVLRGGEEEVPGTWLYEPELGRMRFIADRDFAEGVSYTVEVTLLNTLLPDANYDDEVQRFSFTTGAALDEAPPAFSGLQTIGLTEEPRAESACCASVEEACSCGSCQWCWTVGWRYERRILLSFPTVEDEFGRGSVDYAIVRVDGPGGENPRRVGVIRDANDTVNLRLPLSDAEGSGPYCFQAQALDVFGREAAPTAVRCVEDADLVPVERREVPEPDRSFCLDEDTDAGTFQDTGPQDEDTGTPGEDAAVPDAAPDEPDAETPNVITTGKSDDGCGCAVPSQTPPSHLPFALLLLAPLLLRRR